MNNLKIYAISTLVDCVYIFYLYKIIINTRTRKELIYLTEKTELPLYFFKKKIPKHTALKVLLLLCSQLK